MSTLKVLGLALAFAGATSFAHADDKTVAKPAAKPAAADAAGDQQKMMEAYAHMAEVRAEHKQLAFFDGNWTTKSQMWMDPKGAPMESGGTSKGESLWDGRIHTSAYEGDFMGQKFYGRGELGFENVTGRYFNTWRDSGSTGVWLAYGTYDPATKSYTFRGQMPDPMKKGAMTKVREVMRVVDDNHWSLDWYETHGGVESKKMQIDYARQ